MKHIWFRNYLTFIKYYTKEITRFKRAIRKLSYLKTKSTSNFDSLILDVMEIYLIKVFTKSENNV